jgi:hypothetical protein
MPGPLATMSSFNCLMVILCFRCTGLLTSQKCVSRLFIRYCAAAIADFISVYIGRRLDRIIVCLEGFGLVFFTEVLGFAVGWNYVRS